MTQIIMWSTLYAEPAVASSFEAIQADIPIYTPFVEAQVETEIQSPIEVQSIEVS